MKEVIFIRKNLAKWEQTERLVKESSKQSPDHLADAYTDLIADLSFARTHYPGSRITLYLNNLAADLHRLIYRNKREKWSRVLTFWSQEVPRTMYDARKELLTACVIFSVSIFIGIVSTLNDESFVRLIMGDGYVDMTLSNIARGEPMAVYGTQEQFSMFLGITVNNIRVALVAFVCGLLTSFATGYILLQNGIMLGTFHAFLYQQGLLGESMLAIWLHGTLEISAIVVAGAAGIALGNGWLFPGTYSRMVSFRRGAVRGLKIVVGTVPLFVVAGFIEGFFTRYTQLHNGVRLLFILLSFAFVIYYYIYLPNTYRHGNTKT
ncbi:MAG: stage II sporulation protein M [Bacteroides sp.]|nr:stage II sporulation protein M [Bacteroides sp.]